MIGNTGNSVIKTFSDVNVGKSWLQNVNFGSQLNYGYKGKALTAWKALGYVSQSQIIVDLTEDNTTHKTLFPNWNGDPNTAPTKDQVTGMSLVDNLNNIRYDIQQLKTGTSGVNGLRNDDSSLIFGGSGAVNYPSYSNGQLTIDINHANTNTWTAQQNFSGYPTSLNVAYAIAGSGNINLSGNIQGGSFIAGDLTITNSIGRISWNFGSTYYGLGPDSENWSTPGGNTAIGVIGSALQSFNYRAGSLDGWSVTQSGDSTFKSVFSRSTGQALMPSGNFGVVAGSMIIAKSSSGSAKFNTSLFTTPAGMATGMLGAATYSAGSLIVSLNEPLGMAHGNVPALAVGHFVRMKEGDTDTWLKIATVTDKGSYYQYTASRESGNTTNATYSAGTPVINYGAASDGYLYMSADDVDGPFYSVRLNSATPWSSYTEVGRFGFMRNAFGVAGDYFGFGVGDYAGGNYLKYDSSGGFLLKAGNNGVQLDHTGMTLRVIAPPGAQSLTFENIGTVTGTIPGLGPYSIATVANQGGAGAQVSMQANGISNLYGTSFEVDTTGSTVCYAILKAYGSGTLNGLTIGANSTPNAMLDVRGSGIVTGGFNVGSATGAGAGELKASGSIRQSTSLGARAYHSVAQSVANTTQTKLNLDSESWDTDTIHDLVTNNSRLTCKTAGKYLIVARISFAGNVTGNYRVLNILLNNASEICTMNGSSISSGLAGNVQVSTIYDLAVNDYVEMRAYQDSGGALNASATTATEAEFTMVRIA